MLAPLRGMLRSCSMLSGDAADRSPFAAADKHTALAPPCDAGDRRKRGLPGPVGGEAREGGPVGSRGRCAISAPVPSVTGLPSVCRRIYFLSVKRWHSAGVSLFFVQASLKFWLVCLCRLFASSDGAVGSSLIAV